MRIKSGIFLFLVLSGALAFMPFKVAGQEEARPETPFEKSYKEYQKQIEEYNTAHADYVKKKSLYLRFKTLQSQQDAYDATSKMLRERDDVNITYLKTLRERLSEAIGVDDSVKSANFIRIDDEIGWFTDHQNRIPSAGTLEDLVADSRKAKERFTFESPIFYEALAQIASGKITDFDERLTDHFNNLKTKLDEIKGEERDDYKLSDEKIQQLDRWVFDAENRFLRADEKHAEAEKQIGNFLIQRSNSTGVYTTVILRLNESQQFLRESGNYLTEIIRSIKTKD